MLAAFARSSAKTLALNGYIALVAMLAIYVGARLVSGSFGDVMIEMAIMSVVAIGAKLAMDRWLPAIGVFVLLHGLYDFLLGPHTGVADWYPTLCGAWDMVVGAGLVAILLKKQETGTVLTE